MQRKKSTLIIGPIVAVLIGTAVAIAGGDSGSQIGGISVFLLCGIIAFAVNWLAYIPANIYKTEHYYDITGSISYLSVIATAVVFTSNLDIRAQLAACMVVVWALRLGSFLFLRIRQDGQDDRFDEIKINPLRFFFAWTLQGLWVLLTAACALAIITGGKSVPIGVVGTIGIVMWVVGFLIEVTADRQKRVFKRDTANAGKFINVGLWSWSRHPNYFGEILLWTGMAVLAIPVLSGGQWVTLISPVFVYLLLTRLSGIPTLTEKAQKKWGDDADYQAYLARTSLLIPLPPKK